MIRQIGAGGMGIVYEGSQAFPGGSRRVAVKLIRPELLGLGAATAQKLLRAFETELAALIALDHPYLIKVYTSGRHRLNPRQPAAPWFAMEFLTGAQAFTTTDFLKDPAAKIACLVKACDAIAHAHRLGRLHLDLTPANVQVLPNGDPKVIDFGLGEVLRAERPHLPWLLGRGTLLYMAPEQFDPTLGAIGKPTDVHAMGVLLYQAMAGRLPYDITNRTPDDAAEIRALICSGPRLPLPATLVGKFPGLPAVLERALRLKPTERWTDAGEFGAELGRVVAPKPLKTRSGVARIHAKNVQINETQTIHKQTNTFS